MSDHYCVLFELIVHIEPLPLNIRPQRHIITESAAERFCAIFNTSLLNECSDVDSFMHYYDVHCTTILDQVASLKAKSVSQKKPHPRHNESILNLRRICRKTERLSKCTNLEVHRLYLRELLSSLSEKIKVARSDYFCQLIPTNKKNPKVLLDTINYIVFPAVLAAPAICKAECNGFLHFFNEKIRDIKDRIPQSSCCNLVHVEPPSHTWASFRTVLLECILALMSKMKPSSSASDVLPTRLFQNIFEIVGPWVTKMFNLSLSSGVFPSSLKHAIAEPKLEKPYLDPSDLQNFRPISKLPFLANILEKVVSNQLTSFLEAHSIYDTFQSGFRKHHSTETALLIVSSDILMSANAERCTVVVLLDLSSAFDTVDHLILINRCGMWLG